MKNLLWLFRKQVSTFTVTNQQLLFSLHKNRKHSHSHNDCKHTFPSLSMIQAAWFMESSAAVVERGDVTGHIMQPLHYSTLMDTLKAWNGARVYSLGVPPPRSQWRNEWYLNWQYNSTLNITPPSTISQPTFGVFYHSSVCWEKHPPMLHWGLHLTAWQ